MSLKEWLRGWAGSALAEIKGKQPKPATATSTATAAATAEPVAKGAVQGRAPKAGAQSRTRVTPEAQYAPANA